MCDVTLLLFFQGRMERPSFFFLFFFCGWGIGGEDSIRFKIIYLLYMKKKEKPGGFICAKLDFGVKFDSCLYLKHLPECSIVAG